MGKGWSKDYSRHSVAEKGVKTRSGYTESEPTNPLAHIKFEKKVPRRGERFPVTMDEIKQQLLKVHKVEPYAIERIKRVIMSEQSQLCDDNDIVCHGEYTKPSNIAIYSIPKFGNRWGSQRLTDEQIKDKTLNDTLLHEMGHGEDCHSIGIKKCFPTERAEKEARRFAERIRKELGIKSKKWYYDTKDHPHGLLNPD